MRVFYIAVIRKQKINITHWTSPIGDLIIGNHKGKLCLCDWKHRKKRKSIDQRLCKGLNAEFAESTHRVNEKTIEQLEEYFAHERTIFDIPLKMVGTQFQKEIWKQLLKIPYGETATYTGLAKKMNQLPAIRAVAAANGANAISIIVPCHRIIGRRGSMVGYAGGILAKKKLLLLEGSNKQLTLF